MKKIIIYITTLLLSFQLSAQNTIEDIEKEVAYLAKMLLEKTGKTSYTLKQERTFKPVIGACFSIKPQGIKLTCITPDLDPQKKGMQTGDTITHINGVNFINSDSDTSKKHFTALITSIKSGDELSIKYINTKKENKTVAITVAEVAYPSYTLEVHQ